MELFKIYKRNKDTINIFIPYKIFTHTSLKGNKKLNVVCLTWARSYAWQTKTFRGYWTETTQGLTTLKPSNEKLNSHASQELIKYLFESFSPNEF